MHSSSSPAEGQQVVVVCAFIYNDFGGTTKIFLPKRADSKKFMPSVYELPGGHLDLFEDLEDGLKREIREEFKEEITVGRPFAAFSYTNEVKKSHSIEIVFFAQFKGDMKNITLNPKDHSGYIWLAENELDQMLINGKDEFDEEYLLIKKGFNYLINNY